MEPDNLYIESGLVGEMHVYVYGYNASMNTQIMCNSTDICYLHCNVFGACSNAIFNCQDEQAQCFTLTTDAPSFQPTNNPSYPTIHPTRMPTLIPISPTNNPTSYPTTMNPTSHPTFTTKLYSRIVKKMW